MSQYLIEVGASLFNKRKKVLLIVRDTNKVVKMVHNTHAINTLLLINNCLQLFLNIYYFSEDSFYTSSILGVIISMEDKYLSYLSPLLKWALKQ